MIEQSGEKPNSDSVLTPEPLSEHRNRVTSIEQELDDSTQHRRFTEESLEIFVRDLNNIKKYFRNCEKDNDKHGSKPHETLIEAARTCITGACKHLNLAIGELVDKNEKTEYYYDSLENSRKELEELLKEWSKELGNSRRSPDGTN